MKKILSYSIVILLFICVWSCKNISPDQHRELKLETYRDKMKGAWAGQMAGVGWGLPTEFDYIDNYIPDEEVPEWKDPMVNQQGNDDLYVEMTFMKSMEKYGIDVSIRQAGIDFANTGYTLWAANRTGRRNLRFGISPPASSHPRYSDNCDDIDYQIEADFSGIIAPGMLNVPVEMGEKFGRLMNYGDGMYGGQFVGAMYAAAYFEDDVKKVIETALGCIPQESDYAACVRDVIAWYEANPDDWKATWRLIEENYHNSFEHQKFAKIHDSWIPIDAKLNGAYIVMGLLYGEGDMEKTMKISMQGGKDSDCNPSNAGGVLGTILGFDAIPDKFKTAIDYERKFSYSDYNLNDLLSLTEEFTRKLISMAGGEIIKNPDEDEVFLIPESNPVPTPYTPSFNPAAVVEDSLYTDEELNLIMAYSALHFDPVLSELGMENMEIIHCGKAVRPELINWNGKKDVLATAPMSAERSLLMRFSDNKENIKKEEKPYLLFSASHNEGEQWRLKIKDGQKRNIIVLDTIIAGLDNENPWKSFEIELAKGKPANFNIEASLINNEKAINYWADMRVEYR